MMSMLRSCIEEEKEEGVVHNNDDVESGVGFSFREVCLSSRTSFFQVLLLLVPMCVCRK